MIVESCDVGSSLLFMPRPKHPTHGEKCEFQKFP